MLAINCYENQFEGNGFFAVQTIFKRKVRDSKLFYTTVLLSRLDKKSKNVFKGLTLLVKIKVSLICQKYVLLRTTHSNLDQNSISIIQ